MKSSATQAVLEYLRQNGEHLDSDIAKGIGRSAPEVRVCIAELAARHEVMVCRLIRFKGGKETDALLCRIAGYVPPPAVGRKPAPR